MALLFDDPVIFDNNEEELDDLMSYDDPITLHRQQEEQEDYTSRTSSSSSTTMFSCSSTSVSSSSSSSSSSSTSSSTSSSSSSSSSSLSLCNNVKRCEAILECKEKIQYWTTKLQTLQEEQDRCTKLAQLRIDARTTWRTLSNDEKMEKEFIMAAMDSEDLPSILEDFPNSSFPPHIRLDREVFLKFVKRDDFIYYNEDDDRIFVPPKLRNDKYVIMAIIKKQHPHVIETMSSTLRNDNDILLTLLKYNTTTLPHHFLQHFSERIRSDPILMLEVMKHPYGGIPSLKYVSQSLRNNKGFLLTVIEERLKIRQQNNKATSSTIIDNLHDTEYSNDSTLATTSSMFDILKFASPRLRADRHIVLASVQLSGVNLKYCSYPLRRDRQIVVAACEQDGTSFKYCLPCDLKEELIRDRDFVLNILLKSPTSITRSNTTITTHSSGNGCTAVRDCLTRFYKTDRQVLLQAAQNGFLDWSEIPLCFQGDIDFCKKIIQRNPLMYMELKDDIRENPIIALTVLSAENVSDKLIIEATERCPELLANRDAMLDLAKNSVHDILSETLQFSPIEIRSDKEIMIEAIKNDSDAFEFCSEELQRDEDIVMTAIESSPNSLYLVSDSFQLEHPEIVIKALKRTDSDDLLCTYEDIYEDLWQNRDIAMIWLTKGGAWLDHDFSEDFVDDEDLMLTVAEHNWSEFYYASDSLIDDKEFMLKAVAKDGRVISFASPDIRHDFDTALVAFSNNTEALQYFTEPGDFEFMVWFSKQVRERLEDHEVFMKEVMCAMMASSSAVTVDKKSTKHSHCVLSMLDQGPETTLGYKQLIASYLGLPQGDELRRLRVASENLLSWGF